MKPETIYSAIEKASALIARLDARISATPWAEAWQIRASFLAASRLAAVDGTPTRPGDILGLVMNSPLPSPDAYLPASIGFGHWRRCVARMEFSEVAERLLGRSVSSLQAAAEAQDDWDREDTLSPAIRKAIANQPEQAETVDSYALEISEKALKEMRAFDDQGPVLFGLAKSLRKAVQIDPDPDYFQRIHKLRFKFEKDVRENFRLRTNQPDAPGPAQAEEFLASVKWERKPHLGACFSVVPDRLQELGFTTNRLSCLTGATKRLGFERRLDDRAFVGFLRQLEQDAREGLALLDALSDQMEAFGRSFATKFDQRSPMPLVLYSFLILPAVGSPWIQTALELQKRVTNKLLQQLEEAKLIVKWNQPVVTGVGRPTTLWAAAHLADDFEKTLKARKSRSRPGVNALPSPAEMLLRYRDLDISIPMTIVYARHEQELQDLDKVYGRFFDRNWVKNRASRKPAESENAP